MKSIKEKSQFIQPKAADAARRIPQGIRYTAELGHTQIGRSNQEREGDAPADQVEDTVQQGTSKTADQVTSRLKIGHTRDLSKVRQERSNKGSEFFGSTKKTSKRSPTDLKMKSSSVENGSKWDRAFKSKQSSVPSIQQKQALFQTQGNIRHLKNYQISYSKNYILNSIAKSTQSISSKIVASNKSAIAGIKSIGSLIAAGGWVAIALIIVLVLFGWILTTPAGIFAGGSYENDSSRSVYTVLDELAKEVDIKITEIIEEHGDGCEISIQYEDGNANILDKVGPIVLVAYAVKVSTDPTEPDQVATLDERKETVLRDVFWQAVLIDYNIEEFTEIKSDGTSNENRRLIVNIDCLDADELLFQLGFIRGQIELVQGLLSESVAANAF